MAQESELACHLGSTGAYHLLISSGATSLQQALGLRPAEAGEFSRRAFDAGKLDLTQAGRGLRRRSPHEQVASSHVPLAPFL